MLEGRLMSKMFKRDQLKGQLELSFTKHNDYCVKYYASQAATILKENLTTHRGAEAHVQLLFVGTKVTFITALSASSEDLTWTRHERL